MAKIHKRIVGEMGKRLPLLMTASVDTHGMVGADFDALSREKMYLDAILFYMDGIMKNPEQRIVFVENSGWNLDAMAAKLPEYDKERIEFVALDPALFDISKGKSYNEFLMINMTLEKSRILAADTAFMKVTGRYPIYNIEYFLKTASEYIYEKGYELYGDIKDHKVFEWLGLPKAYNGHAGYTVLFGVTKECWLKNLGSRYQELNDSEDRLAEYLFYDYVVKFRGKRDSKVVCRFKREPVCGGFQGSNVKTIAFTKSNMSLKARGMRFAGNCIRLFLPWFWF